jgi:hypothetical protein
MNARMSQFDSNPLPAVGMGGYWYWYFYFTNPGFRAR